MGNTYTIPNTGKEVTANLNSMKNCMQGTTDVNAMTSCLFNNTNNNNEVFYIPPNDNNLPQLTANVNNLKSCLTQTPTINGMVKCIVDNIKDSDNNPVYVVPSSGILLNANVPDLQTCLAAAPAITIGADNTTIKDCFSQNITDSDNTNVQLKEGFNNIDTFESLSESPFSEDYLKNKIFAIIVIIIILFLVFRKK